MAIPSGLGSQIGAKKETVYGTPVTVDRFFEFSTESIAFDKNYRQSTQLRAGRVYPSASRRRATTRQAAGAINMDVPTKGFGFWLDLLHDLVPTVVQQGTTIAYKQTHDIGRSPSSKSATIQKGVPTTEGVVEAFTYPGCMVTTWTLAIDVNGVVTAALNTDSQDELTSDSGGPALAIPSYPSDLRDFGFEEGSLSIGATQIAVVRQATINGGPPRKIDRFFLGTSGKKKKPLPNAYATGEASFVAEFDGMAHYNRFRNNTLAEVVLEFVGQQIVAGQNERLKVIMPAVGWESGTPLIDGPDVVDYTLAARILDDNGTVPPTRIEYTSTDITV